MITLSGTSDLVRITLGGSTTTNPLDVTYAYVDLPAHSPVGSSATQSTTGPTTVVSSPGSNVQRVVDYLSVLNTDTVSATITLSHYNGTNDRRLWKGTLAAGESVLYSGDRGWRVFDASGVRKVVGLAGSSPTPVNLVGSWTTDSNLLGGSSYTPETGSNRIAMVALQLQSNSTSPISFSAITLGGQTPTQAVNQLIPADDYGFHGLLWIGYMKESQIAAMSGSTLSITWTNTPVNPDGDQTAVYATYENVDQTSPIRSSNSATSHTGTTQQPGNVSVSEGDRCLFVTWHGYGGTLTAPSGYTERCDFNGGTYGVYAAGADRDTTTASTENPTATHFDAGISYYDKAIGAIVLATVSG